jgi:hypothetical protein
MKATKIFIVLAATAAISLAVIGVAYGYYVSNQTTVNPNSPYAPYTAGSDFWGWFGGCLGFRQEPYAHQYQYPGNSTTQPPATVPPQQPYQPYQPQYPDQGYSYGYRRGCGW